MTPPLRIRNAAAPWVLAVVLSGCLGGALSRPVPEVVAVHPGTFLEVACHFECGALGVEALRTGELAWRWAAVLLGTDTERPEADPPTLHLFANRDDYLAAEARVARGVFRDREGFSSRKDRAAFVFLPALPGPYLEHTGLPLRARKNIAHEAAHLAAYDLALGAYWPPWLAEGLATWVEREVVVRPADVGPIAARSPWAATQAWRVQRLLRADALPTIPDLLTGAPLALSVEDAYAVWTETFDFLVRSPFAPEMRALLRKVAETPIPGDRAWPAVAEIAEREFGRERMEEADAAFRRHVVDLRPGWVELFRSLEQSIHGPDTWLQYASSSLAVGALSWRTAEPGGREGVLVQGSVRSLAGGPWEIRIALMPSEGFPLLVAVASDGRVRLTQLQYERPNRLVTLASDALALPSSHGPETRVSVQFLPGQIRVLAGDDPSGVSFEGLDFGPEGTWGVGVAPGTAVVWEGLRGSSLPAGD